MSTVDKETGTGDRINPDQWHIDLLKKEHERRLRLGFASRWVRRWNNPGFYADLEPTCRPSWWNP